MDIALYDRRGVPMAYSDDNEHIYLFSGAPVAYVLQDSVHSYPGRHLGWFDDGWIRDNEGAYAFFTDDARGWPMTPMKGMKAMRPMKGMRDMRPMRPMKSSSWSQLLGVQFFNR